MILFTEDQRRLFEYLPKPDVADSKNKLSIYSILKYKTRAKTRQATKNLSNTMKLMAEDNDPINKRLLDCLDQKIIIKHEDLESNDGNFYGLFFFFYSKIKANWKENKNIMVESLPIQKPKKLNMEFSKVNFNFFICFFKIGIASK